MLGAGVIGGLLSFVVINGINAVLDQALEAVGYVPKLIHRASGGASRSAWGPDAQRWHTLAPTLRHVSKPDVPAFRSRKQC